MRIAVGGFHIESSNYNPSLTRAEDFRIMRGQDLLAAPAFQCLKEFDAEFLPTFYARAVPGAPIERATYDAFKLDFLTRLAAFGPIDGLLLVMHGAAFVEGMEDTEADFFEAVRAAVGPHCPISVSYDLHANVSQRVVDCIDMFTAYRTAPHIDAEDTIRRAVRMLMRAIATGERPSVLWCPIPVVLPGERTSTLHQPAKGLYDRLAGMEAPDGIWDAALMVGYIWADEPRVSAAVVMTGTDDAGMAAAATALAADYWAAREQFVFGTRTGTTQDCIGWALESETGPVVLADSGDNPTAGGAGDRAELLADFLARGASHIQFVGIADRPATEAAYAAGVGAILGVSIGASIDPAGSKPVEARAQVRHIVATDQPLEREAVLRVDGIDIVVSARRRPYHFLRDFERLQLDPHAARVIVVKSGYLEREIDALANPSIMALSPGIVDQSVERLPRTRTSRPLFPLDRDFDYTPRPRWSARKRALR